MITKILLLQRIRICPYNLDRLQLVRLTQEELQVIAEKLTYFQVALECFSIMFPNVYKLTEGKEDFEYARRL